MPKKDTYRRFEIHSSWHAECRAVAAGGGGWHGPGPDDNVGRSSVADPPPDPVTPIQGPTGAPPVVRQTAGMPAHVT